MLWASLSATAATALLALSSVDAKPVDSNAASSNLKPWPKIPDPSKYSTPKGNVYVRPVSQAKGLTSQTSSKGSKFMYLNGVGDMYTLDYGRDVAGLPVFDVQSLKSPYAQIEVKYTEAFNGLKVNYSDGPFAFSNGLANTFRVETFNLTKKGEVVSSLAQGSQRWQSVKLIKGSGVVLKSAGFISTVDEAPLSSMPGYFASSDEKYTNIWNLGPRTTQLTCFKPGTQKSTWIIDKTKGAYVRGQKPATTIKGANAKNYTMSFESMIEHGALGWRLDTEVDNIWAEGPLFVLTSNYPAGSFANINQTLFPPNSLVLGRGWLLQNQTTLANAWHLDTFKLGSQVTENTWHKVETDSRGDGTYVVRLNGKQIASFDINSYGVGKRPPYFPPCPYYSFAIGAGAQDTSAWYRNVKMTLKKDGSTFYSNPMTSQDVLLEYGVATNDYTVCSDAGKRDRFSWLGDREISARSVEASGQFDLVRGPAEQAFSRQSPSGLVPANTLFSQLDKQGGEGRTDAIDLILVDWDNRALDVIYHYWMKTGDNDFIKKYWQQMIKMLDYTLKYSIDPKTNFSTNGGSGPTIGSSCNMVQSLEEMVAIGQGMGYGSDPALARYAQQAQATRGAINGLWNETGGYFHDPNSNGWTFTDLSWIELIKAGTASQRNRFWSLLPARAVPGGYADPPAGGNFNLLDSGLHPVTGNDMGYLLWALAERGDGVTAKSLLDRHYGVMADTKSVNYTGGYWEFVSRDGTYPGNDLETAQSHAWGAFPTAFMNEYVLGVTPRKPGFVEFNVKPLSNFNVSWAQGRVPTPQGQIYVAVGKNKAGKWQMEITAPKGTKGYVTMPFSGKYSVNGQAQRKGQLFVQGGSPTYNIVQA
ncbi:hypothetical protein OIV83_002787 [Microbotryomycetes sp. JL201]|nr:hypothetical protein OIV83_002787 [Microbotryomycetes sp. JL201]